MPAKNSSHVKQEILNVIDRRLGPNYLLIAFGSYPKGKIDRLSDIDLALYREEPFPTLTFLEIKEDLDTKVHTLRTFDVVNLNDESLNLGLLENILHEGVLWKKPPNYKELLKSLKKRLKNTAKR